MRGARNPALLKGGEIGSPWRGASAPRIRHRSLKFSAVLRRLVVHSGRKSVVHHGRKQVVHLRAKLDTQTSLWTLPSRLKNRLLFPAHSEKTTDFTTLPLPTTQTVESIVSGCGQEVEKWRYRGITTNRAMSLLRGQNGRPRDADERVVLNDSRLPSGA